MRGGQHLAASNHRPSFGIAWQPMGNEGRQPMDSKGWQVVTKVNDEKSFYFFIFVLETEKAKNFNF